MKDSRSNEQLELLGRGGYSKNKPGIPNLDFYWSGSVSSGDEGHEKQLVSNADEDEPGTNKGLLVVFFIILGIFIYMEFLS